MSLAKEKKTLIPRITLMVIFTIAITICATPAQAGFDYLFFGVNGDTTLSSMTQGDEFYWGSNCDLGATINWEVWFDANSNSTIDPGTDPILTSENITDGSLLTDFDGAKDGWAVGEPFILSGQPGTYLFRAKDIATDSVLTKTMTMIAMVSPPNQLTGQISLPGITAPNSLLANRIVFAESDTGDEGAFLGVTDNNGLYSMNIGLSGNGVEFFINVNQIPGYVAPDYISAIASGVVSGNDFAYETAVDSVYGFVKDDLGALINFEGGVYALPFIGDGEFGTNTTGSRYAIYFSTTSKGGWDLSIDDYVYSPIYLGTGNIQFSHDTLTSFQHDFELYRADTSIFVRVTENGGLPVNNYLINASSGTLNAWNDGVSGTGSDNLAEVRVTSQDASGWFVTINNYNDEFPIPAGLIVENEANNVSPGDTVTLNLINGNQVNGRIYQDPGDSPINWDMVNVNGNDGGTGNYNTTPDVGGNYFLYTSSGAFNLNVWADGYMTNPAWINLTVAGDTSSSDLDFIINETHCRVSGQLTNVTLPLDNAFYGVFARTNTDGTDGYVAYAQIDSVTGTYEMFLPDGNWTISAPCCFPNSNPPTDTTITIGEAPDTTQTLDLVYSIILGIDDELVGVIPNSFDLQQNYPNPFNPTTEITFALPTKSDVSVIVYNTLGQKVKTLVNQSLTAGYHVVEWDGKNTSGESVASGVYLYKIEAGDFISTKKMMLLK